jgi:hypothetical protein
MPLVELSRRLVLCYNRGQFSFRTFDRSAAHAPLLSLAQGLNAFQTDAMTEARLVRRVQVSL